LESYTYTAAITVLMFCTAKWNKCLEYTGYIYIAFYYSGYDLKGVHGISEI